MLVSSLISYLRITITSLINVWEPIIIVLFTISPMEGSHYESFFQYQVSPILRSSTTEVPTAYVDDGLTNNNVTDIGQR